MRISMPEIEQVIEEWRREIARTIGSDVNTLDEYEGHLRQKVYHRIEQGYLPELALREAIGEFNAWMLNSPHVTTLRWKISFTVTIFLVALLVFLAKILDNFNDPPRSVWLLIGNGALTTGYCLCFGIGTMANWLTFQRAKRFLSAIEIRRWRVAQMWIGLPALTFLIIGVGTGSFWSIEVQGVLLALDEKETWQFFLLCWLILHLLLTFTSHNYLRFLLWIGLCGPFFVSYAMNTELPLLVFVVAVFELPALVIIALPERWLLTIRSILFRQSVNKSMGRYEQSEHSEITR